MIGVREETVTVPWARGTVTVAVDGRRFLINTPVEGSQSAPLTVITNFPSTLKK